MLSYLFRKKGRHHRLDTPAFSCTFKIFLQKFSPFSSFILLSGCLLASAFEWGYSYANWAHFNISSGKGQKNLVKFHKKAFKRVFIHRNTYSICSILKRPPEGNVTFGGSHKFHYGLRVYIFSEWGRTFAQLDFGIKNAIEPKYIEQFS